MLKILKKIYDNMYIQYTFLFFLLLGIIFSPNWYYDKGFIWKNDGPLVHYPTFVYYGNFLKDLFINIINGNFNVKLFDFSIEGGGDVLQTLHVHVLGDPFNFLALFFANNNFEIGYNFLIILRMFLAGVAFCFLGKYFKFEKNGILLGALMYCFCGYAIYASIKHPYFTNPMIFLPLLILGIEKIIKESKYKYFLICLPITAISNFYFFYMIMLFLICYVILRLIYIYINQKKIEYGLFIKISITTLLGIGIASIILVPMIFFVLSASRSSGYELPFIYLYNWKNYLNMISEFFIGWKGSGFWIYLHYPLIIFFSLLIIFKYNKFKYLKLLFLLNTIILCSPILGYIWNGGSYISNRNIWCYSLLISYIFMSSYKYIFSITEEHIKYVKKVLAIFILIELLFIIVSCIDSLGYSKARLNYMYINMTINIVGLIVIFISLNLRNKRYREKIVFFLVILNIIFNGLYVTSNLGYNYANQYLKNGDINENLVWNNSDDLKIKEFYRIEINNNENNLWNNALRENYSSVSSMYSLSNRSFTDFYDIMQLPVRGLIRTGVDDRTILSAISNILYVKNYKENEILYPYGFERVSSNTMKNKYLLPLAYTYDKFFIRSNDMNALYLESNMLDAIILEKDIDGVEYVVKSNNIQEINTTISFSKSIRLGKDEDIFVKKKNSKINISFEKNKSIFGEYYLYIPYIENLNKYGENPTDNVIYFKSNNLDKYIVTNSRNHPFFVENKGILINLGWKKDNENIDIVIENKGHYKFKMPKILFLPLNNYEEKIAKLKENALQNINIGTNEITGDISVDKKKLLFFSVPYSKGWEAFIDGEKTDIYKANIMYMAIPLEAGNHHIELKYRTPYLDLGIGISIVSLFLSVGWFMYLKKYK